MFNLNNSKRGILDSGYRLSLHSLIGSHTDIFYFFKQNQRVKLKHYGDDDLRL